MVYIQFEKETEARALVTFIHYKPLDPNEGLGKTADELSLTGVFIDALPQRERPLGKDAKLYFNPQTKETWYEYVDIPLPDNERITQVEISTEENKKANLDTQEAVLQLYEMVTGPLT
ncbi:hypothetical protein BRE01_48640 [Brevibacillus reuszeri]|uniref:Uncharacterized protein n=1 Tax=Brevibacillus reuszeri TaxID=54915 RepID=A0ABQ0TTF6_9BACL|nr:hypothetical protein [Brevibacillus reuszeri]MED1861705.1 hypothetical protein [Brevibacillus reuszeri]GED71162.1 hypothetical protein BRE01_48640 [Brevibacillus reuszeri]